MSRISRVVIPGIAHHVTQRGVRSMDIFKDAEDRELYLKLFVELQKRYELEVLSWCLMSNHVHFVVIPPKEDSIARVIGETHRLYTRAINFKAKMRGHLFQERFFSCPMDDKHCYSALRYVEQNPVRANMVESAWDYQWSSARFHVDGSAGDRLVKERHPFGLDTDWREFLQADLSNADALRNATKTGRPCGGSGFVGKIEELTGRDFRRGTPGPKKRNN